MSKLVPTLKEAIQSCGLENGMTISFHHHLRNGDYTLNMVMEEIAALGIRDLTINASSIHDVHTPLVEHMKSGVVTGLETDYIAASVGTAISAGVLKNPVIFRTHGGRPADIEKGASHIDVAFIAAPTADCQGNCTGTIGKSACGSLGYAFSDAAKADKVVIITDNLVPYPLALRSISEYHVDYVVAVESIGDPSHIASGTTKMPRDPLALRMADIAAKAIDASGLLVDGVSFQTGAGGASLATAASLRRIMLEKKIHGSYALGGITGYIVDMLHEGCFESIQDVQCFDMKAVESLRDDPNHFEISAVEYASPDAKSSAASNLDVVVLGATEIDTAFNVNVHTDSNGKIIGGSGGHSDVAEEAKLTLIVAPLSRARMSIVVDHVGCISTPGASVDMLVTPAGIAVNPSRPELAQRLKAAHLPVVDIHVLKEKAERLNGVAEKAPHLDRVVAKVLDRRGNEIDRIYQIQE
jgi:citrate lyase subunit alpha/citrate CoA-transferase